MLFVKTQPVAGLQLSSVHALLSLQTLALPGWQLPPPHVSPTVQAFPSVQALVLFVNTHPDAGLQLSFVHPLLSLQTTAAPGWHVPPPHTSPDVHAFASSQGTVLFVNTHPVAGLQLSFVQPLPSTHTIGVPTQAPPVQVSPCVQALESVQGSESGITVAVVGACESGQAVPVMLTVYVPEASTVTFGIVGFCSDDVNPFGPVHAKVAPGIVGANSWSVPPAQTGPLLVTAAGPG